MRAVEALVQGVALLLEDLLEALLDVLEGGREVEPVEGLAALLAQLLQQVAQALRAVAHGVAHAALQQVAQGVLQVTEVHQVIGEGIEDIVRIEGRDFLRAVPLGVAISDEP